MLIIYNDAERRTRCFSAVKLKQYQNGFDMHSHGNDRSPPPPFHFDGRLNDRLQQQQQQHPIRSAAPFRATELEQRGGWGWVAGRGAACSSDSSSAVPGCWTGNYTRYQSLLLSGSAPTGS